MRLPMSAKLGGPGRRRKRPQPPQLLPAGRGLPGDGPGRGMIGASYRSGPGIMKRLLTLLVALALLAFLPGCETVKGAGRDIEKAGEAIQRAAN